MPALILDCDGVLADTERDGHLPAFNATFAEVGLPVRWTDREYADKVRIAGGKERMASLLTPELVRDAGLPADPAGQGRLLADWHRRKTAHFRALVADGRLPGRPGVGRVVTEALADGWAVAVASTSAEESVRAVVEHVVPEAASEIAVFAGDAVPRKKPAPDIYLLALDGLGVAAADAVAVEDSGGGLAAALAAGLATVITVSGYTSHDDFSGAALVVSSLGDEREAVTVIADPLQLNPVPLVHVGDLRAVLKQQPAHQRRTSWS